MQQLAIRIGLYSSVHDGWPVGWSDKEIFFGVFKNGHYAADQVYFYESNSIESANLAALARHSFHFQKITGTLK